MVIIVAGPGQGAQKPGFLEPWLEDDQSLNLLRGLSESVELDLVEHGTRSDAETIKDTAIAQPLIVASGILTAERLFRGVPLRSDGTLTADIAAAGHSVGEITAATVAKILTPAQAMAFVHIRATGMAAAAAETPTTMAAVLGGNPEEVLAAFEQRGVVPANFNGGGQIVAAGPVEAIANLAANPPAKARVIPLSVAGAFHTIFMESAIPALDAFATSLAPSDPVIDIYTNADGSIVRDGRSFLSTMVRQVASPVHWDKIVEAIAPTLTGFIELAPGGTLAGLIKRQCRGVPTVALRTPDDLEAASELLRSSAEALTPDERR